MLLEISYVKGFNGAIGALDEKISLTDMNGSVLDNDAQYALRSVENVMLDVTRISIAIEEKKTDIQSVRLALDSRLKLKGIDELKNMLGGKLKEEMR